VQGLLKALGYRPGPTDGLLGRRTVAAVKAFQRDLKLTPTGAVSEELLVLLKGAAVVAKPPARRRPVMAGSGSGFIVSTEGFALTNYHVIKGCASVSASLDGKDKRVTVAGTDKANDLALLKLSGTYKSTAHFRASRRYSLGEKGVVAGFPLKGVLSSGLNVTAGTVTALSGLGNDARELQMSAPVQAGNSGGPLLDKSGNVMGVVVSKLNVMWTAKVIGDVPQNVNFAIKGVIARGFLDTYSVNYSTTRSNRKLDTTAIATAAQKFTVAVECWK